MDEDSSALGPDSDAYGARTPISGAAPIPMAAASFDSSRFGRHLPPTRLAGPLAMIRSITTLPPTLPRLTLGWDVAAWTGTYIRQPDGPTAGEPWRYTPEQLRFLLHWYAIDERGQFVYTRGVLRRSKGWGKSPFVASLALCELCGPVRFERFAEGGERRPWHPGPYEPGEPITMPVSMPWVQLAGVSEKQTTNTYTMVTAMCGESPIVADYGLDLGLSRVLTANRGRLEPITASAPTAEGARPTFVVEDETEWWTSANRALQMDLTNRRNVAKIPGGTGRVLETTNAHAVGEGSVAEKSYEAYLSQRDGRTRAKGMLYDSREPDADVNLADEMELLDGLQAAYGDSTWVDKERLCEEIWDPVTPPSYSRRFYLNQVSTAVDAWISEPEWAGCADPFRIVADGDVIVVGFDGSRHRNRGVTDATALVGCRVDDGHLFEIGVWEQPEGPAGKDWWVPVSEVEAAVRETFDRYEVVGMFADPTLWESTINAWEARYIAQLQVRASRNHPMHWNPGGSVVQIVKATAALHEAILQQTCSHDGSFRLTKHMLNARRRDCRTGIQVVKEFPDSPRKIDACVAAIFAWAARLEALSAGLAEPQPAGFVPWRIR